MTMRDGSSVEVNTVNRSSYPGYQGTLDRSPRPPLLSFRRALMKADWFQKHSTTCVAGTVENNNACEESAGRALRMMQVSSSFIMER